MLTKNSFFRYFGAYIIFVAFLFGSAFAQNYATLIVTRFVRESIHIPVNWSNPILTFPL